jgi:hypothetical protein
MKLGAEAVPPVTLVWVDQQLIDIENRLDVACPSLAHGSKNASTNCTGRSDFSVGEYCKLPINRSRVAGLAVLYGLALASDHQVIYRVGGEPIVFSVDHGHFFHGGTGWTEHGFENAPQACIDPVIVRSCSLTEAEIAPFLDRLGSLAANDFAEAVAAPPDVWIISESDRIAIARYLWSRREALLKS